YVFVNDLVPLAAQGIAKAPNLDTASIFNGFLAGVLDPENDLFMRFFDELGATEEDYSSAKASPTTQAFGDFLVRTSLEGTFDEIALVLYVTEGTYLDWGTRLLKEGANPENFVYREWIDLHGPAVLGGLVSWLEGYINNHSKITEERADYLFHTALRYEFLFWEAAYSDERWFDI
ncbi:TenA family protein, partial [Chloroflexi bacterium]|nr:TenA family protein [Chloroflexota bacterium]